MLVLPLATVGALVPFIPGRARIVSPVVLVAHVVAARVHPHLAHVAAHHHLGRWGVWMVKDLGADPAVLAIFALGHAGAAPEAVDGPSTRLDRAAALTASTVGADPEAQEAALALSAALALGAPSSRLESKLVALGAACLRRDGRLSPTL